MPVVADSGTATCHTVDTVFPGGRFDTSLQDASEEVKQRFYADKLGSGLAPRTVTTVEQVLEAAPLVAARLDPALDLGLGPALVVREMDREHRAATRRPGNGANTGVCVRNGLSLT